MTGGAHNTQKTYTAWSSVPRRCGHGGTPSNPRQFYRKRHEMSHVDMDLLGVTSERLLRYIFSFQNSLLVEVASANSFQPLILLDTY